MLRLEEKRLEDGFNLIKQSAEDYNRNTQYRYSKMLEAEKKYRSNKQSDQLKFRSRS